MPNIVVIDDESEITELLAEYLNEFGHKVTQFTDPHLALDLLNSNDDIDLVLSDIKMPQMNGFDLLTKYKMSKQNQARFILMTGYSDLLNLKKAYTLGVDELLSKPFDLESLKLAIDRTLNFKK